MQKLSQKTPNKTEQHIQNIAQLFPNVVSEGEDGKRVVDFDLLRQMLSDELVEGADERYRLDWVGKRASLLKANSAIDKTLRPCREESVEFDTTENLYIEGDNFEVLKLIQESYLGKVKMIYIDPPYNTGKDFVYRDNFTASKEEYEEEMGLRDEEENKLFKNTDSNGRFHSDWLSMMYERLLVSRDLLKDDGVIFISIDDNEVHNLRKICDEVFGENNFVADSIWRSTDNSNNDAKQFSSDYNHTLIYSKNSTWLPIKISDSTKQTHFKNPDNDPKGAYFDGNPLNSPNPRENLMYDLVSPNGKIITAPKNGWRWSKKTIEEKISTGEIRFTKNEENIRRRTYLSDMKGLPPSNLWIDLDKTGHNRQSKYELLKIIPEDIFDTPKPVKLLKYILQISGSTQDDIVLDFFSGSATTAHAVMQLNAEDEGNRKYIMIQLSELTEETSKAYKAGYKNIPEIGKERIRRAGRKINEELKTKNEKLVDIGFRVLKVDSSNMKDVYYHPTELGQNALAGMESNIKEDRDEMDLLFATMLELGVELSLKITPQSVDDTTIYVVAEGELVACFSDNISTKVIDAIKALTPLQVVLKDGCFANDNDKINGVESLSKVANVSVL